MDEMTPFPFNRDWQRRNTILQPFLRTDGPFAEFDGAADIIFFQGVPVGVVGQLLEERYLDPDRRQNDSPTSSEFFAFLRRHPEVLAHGYATSIEREDYRVTIEGVSYRGTVSGSLRRDAEQLFRGADEFRLEANGLFVWFD
jgi:hypothetical protein